VLIIPEGSQFCHPVYLILLPLPALLLPFALWPEPYSLILVTPTESQQEGAGLATSLEGGEEVNNSWVQSRSLPPGSCSPVL
jgi:hypothetical protein